MRTLPRITIITATYNAEKTIEQTISSVLSQDYKNIEYIIVDGESRDKTLEIINKYKNDERLTFISEPDRGLYDALNKGVKMATGNYIEVIGSDDALTDSHIISTVVNELKKDVDVFSGMEYGVDEKTCRQHIICDNHVARNKSTYNGGMIGHAGMLVKKELLEKYPFDISYKIAADYKFFLQCYFDYKVRIQFSDTIIAFFSLSGMSSNTKACRRENYRLYQELGLPFMDIRNDGTFLKRGTKAFIRYVGIWHIFFLLYRPISHFLYSHFIWKKHTCKNKICRWCGRI